MKNIIFSISLLLFAPHALASDLVMGVLIGSMLGGTEEITKEVKMDKFTMVVEQVHKKMDENIQNRKPSVTIDFNGFNVEEYETYFKMKNFDVLKEGTKLTFNLTPWVLGSINNQLHNDWWEADRERSSDSLTLWFVVGLGVFLALLVTIGENAFLVMMLFNVAWFAASGVIFMPELKKPAQVTSLPPAINKQLPQVWQTK